MEEGCSSNRCGTLQKLCRLGGWLILSFKQLRQVMLRAMWNGFNIIQRPALHTRFPAQWTALWALTKNCRSPSRCVEQAQTFFTFNVRGPSGSSVSRQLIQGIPSYPKASHPSRLSTIQKKYRITGGPKMMRRSLSFHPPSSPVSQNPGTLKTSP